MPLPSSTVASSPAFTTPQVYFGSQDMHLRSADTRIPTQKYSSGLSLRIITASRDPSTPSGMEVGHRTITTALRHHRRASRPILPAHLLSRGWTNRRRFPTVAMSPRTWKGTMLTAKRLSLCLSLLSLRWISEISLAPKASWALSGAPRTKRCCRSCPVAGPSGFNNSGAPHTTTPHPTNPTQNPEYFSELFLYISFSCFLSSVIVVVVVHSFFVCAS